MPGEPKNPGLRIEKLLEATLDADWSDYEVDQIPEHYPLSARQAIKRAFFAGAWVGLMDAVLVSDDNLLTVEDAQVYLKARMQEAIDFMNLVDSGLA